MRIFLYPCSFLDLLCSKLPPWRLALNYIGSKKKLLAFIEQVWVQICEGDEKIFCDLFAGTGIVGRHFKHLGFQIIANDLQYYSYIINKAELQASPLPAFRGLKNIIKPSEIRPFFNDVFHHLNDLPGIDGFIAQNYSPLGKRLYFTQENAQKIDAIRQKIEEWFVNELIDHNEYSYLLASLIKSSDKISNTASVYSAYLKNFKSSSLRNLELKPIEVRPSQHQHVVHHTDANELIDQISCDILYLDPPYNHRQYGANYHILETIALYDAPKISGISGIRSYKVSKYSRVEEVKSVFEHLIDNAQAKHVLLSYNDDGLMSDEYIKDVLGKRGTVTLYATAQREFVADRNRQYKKRKRRELLYHLRVKG